MTELSTLPGLPVTGSIEPTEDGGYVLHLRAAIPCRHQVGAVHVIEAEHVMPPALGLSLHHVIAMPHVYEYGGAFIDLWDRVGKFLVKPTKKQQAKLETLFGVMDSVYVRALDTVMANDDGDEEGDGEADDTDPLDMEGFFAWLNTNRETDGSLNAEKLLATFEGGHRARLKVVLDDAISKGLCQPYPGYDGPLPPSSGAEPPADVARDTAPDPAKPGRIDPQPQRTVVVSVTRKQAEDYAARGAFVEVTRETFPGNAVSMDMRLDVETAEKMFTDAETNGGLGSGPRRRIFLSAADRLRAALNRDPE